MPPAVALAIPAVLGAGATAANGKKGSNAASTAANNQFQLQSTVANNALSNIGPAATYYKALLSGDPTQIAAAVGPTSDILKQQGQSQAQQIAATTPAGGEAQQAETANSMNTYNQMARLYAGVQPAAAQALGGLGQGELGAAAPNVGSGLKYNTHQTELAGQNKGALGSGLGSLGATVYNGKRSGSGSKSGSSGSGSSGGGSSQKVAA